MNDAPECLRIVTDQTGLLKKIIDESHKRLESDRYEPFHDVAMFIIAHGWNIYEMAKASIRLMEKQEPFAIVVLARAALESTFNLVAATSCKEFGPQKIAFESEELAAKIELLIAKQAWIPSREPKPTQCRDAAIRILKKYKLPSKEWKQTEQIAQRAGLSPYYDDDYRFLSMGVHGNQFGIWNTGSGFLVRKGLLSVSNSLYFAGVGIANAFGTRDCFDPALQALRVQMEDLMRKPDFIQSIDDLIEGKSAD